jgi:hypothetical protein
LKGGLVLKPIINIEKELEKEMLLYAEAELLYNNIVCIETEEKN